MCMCVWVCWGRKSEFSRALWPIWLLQSSPHFVQDSLNSIQCLAVGLFPSVAGWNLSDDNWTRHNLYEYSGILLDINILIFVFVQLGLVLILGLRAMQSVGHGAQAGSGMGSHFPGMGFSWTSCWLATPSISRLPSLSTSLGRIDCRSKVMWLGWFLGTVFDSFIMLKDHKL